MKFLNRTIAFGGYSFAGVGQYEVLTGIATGEVNPHDKLNKGITDIEFAPLNGNGNVVYQHNFYILKPLDLRKGNHKMMYEPPNRGGKTYGTINNTPTSGNDPATAFTNSTVLSGSLLLDPRLYDRLERLGKQPRRANRRDGDGEFFRSRHGLQNSTITGPGYEYIVTSAATYTLAYPAASGNQDPPNAVLTHRVHLDEASRKSFQPPAGPIPTRPTRRSG